MNHWLDLPPAQVRERLGCGLMGLAGDEAARRLDRSGPNRLPTRPPRPAWAVFLDQFRNLLTQMLLAAGLVAGLVGDTTDMVVVLVVTLFNACLGFAQERRAGRMLDALQAMLAQKARVRRDGAERLIPAEELVEGDLVLLRAGDRVPADGRLVEAEEVEADEQVLTGEAEPVAKTCQALAAADLPLADLPLAERANMAFMNTVLTRGRAVLAVTATGAATEMGKVALMLGEAEEAETPLQQRLGRLGHRLALLAAVVVAVVLLRGFLAGEPWGPLLLTAVALAVAAIPEGLPAVVTITLALGMMRMAAKGAVVRRLAAVETLGCTSVICSDKTGTLTQGRMEAVRLWTGLAYAEPDLEAGEALLPAALCTEARFAPDGSVLGEPTEVALLRLAARAGAMPAEGEWRRLAEIPFNSATKMMAVLAEGPLGRRMLVKGAPAMVLERCGALSGPDGVLPLDGALRQKVEAEVEAMAGQALRVIALAARPAGSEEDLAGGMPRDLVLLALVGLADPPRPGAVAAVAECRAAGIMVKMITGDHRATAAAVAAQLGLEGEVVEGRELDRLDDAALAARAGTIAVFARVSPEHKVRIVRALQSLGHVTAMTGDGVNDAAALKAAHMGVAMGRTGSDVTREAASMVLSGDDFTTVVEAVREGRVIAGNIVKFVRFQLATNLGALLAVLLAPLAGLPVPFSAIQILWVNIIMDGPPALSLAFDPAPPGLMRRPPDAPDAPILPPARLVRLALLGLLMAAGTLGMLWWGLEGGAGLVHAQTMAFTTFVLFQVFNAFNAREEKDSVLGRRAFTNGRLWIALAAVVLLQVVVVEWGPAQALFHTSGLSAREWGLAAALAASALVWEEGRKALGRLLGAGRRPLPPLAAPGGQH